MPCWLIECEVIWVNTMPSTVEHHNVGVDVFATRTKSKCKSIWTFYSSSVCADLSKQLHEAKEYGEETMAVLILLMYPSALQHSF